MWITIKMLLNIKETKKPKINLQVKRNFNKWSQQQARILSEINHQLYKIKKSKITI